MEWKEYEYTVAGPTVDTVARRPLLETAIYNRAGKLSILALIDSGTDSVVANSDIAEALGIEPETCRKIQLGGIGQKNGFVCEVNLYIEDFKYDVRTPVIFIEKPPFDLLLGQRPFFEDFVIRFERARNTFYLQRDSKG